VKEILAARGLSMQAGEGGAPAAAPGEAAPAAPGGASSEENLKKNLNDYEWSGRIKKVFEKLGLVTVGDLLKVTESDLLKNKNLGMTSIKEIRKRLGQLGLAMREE
jgi:DNA-directed RNA polymerase alpha subunit